MNEQSGVLRPAIEAYLRGGRMTAREIAAMRAYLRQWIAGDFRGCEIGQLRILVNWLDSREKIEAWIDLAIAAGIDPL